MKRIRLFAFVALAGLVLEGPALSAQETLDEDTYDLLIQPGAVDAVKEMAEYMQGMDIFKLVATTKLDDILDNNQLIEISGTTTVVARLPDRLRVTIDNDKIERDFYYDGKTVTQYAPTLGVYSVVDAPETITKMLAAVQKKYGVELPLADLFYWTAEDTPPIELEIAYFAGETIILGNTCRHYAYRVEEADVQIWIQKDGPPLPCRIVITNIAEAARPQYGATLVWNEDTVIGEGMFSFSPPPGVEEIPQTPVEEAN